MSFRAEIVSSTFRFSNMERLKYSWTAIVLAAISFPVKETLNEPQGFDFAVYQNQYDDFVGGPSFKPPRYQSSNFFGKPSGFYPTTNDPFFNTGRTPFVGYGPNYFQSINNNNIGFNFGQSQCPRLGRNCVPSKYRTIDGSCNNIKNPLWGLTNTNYGRLVTAKYADGIHQPPISVTGKPLPPSRLLSVVLFPDVDVPDPQWTLAAMQWGQIITHDMSIAAGTTQSHPHPTQCCSNDGRDAFAAEANPSCFPIIVPLEDPLSKKFGQRCMNFVRTTTDQDSGCAPQSQPAEQVVGVTHWLDGSFVYGSDDQLARSLRAFKGGLLQYEYRNGRIWPPANPNKTLVCQGQTSPDQPCYMTGDTRANQNPQLTIFQILLLREHNRLASKLAEINPHWNDEILYQEARRILIGEVQHISYYEWLPIFLGWKNLLAHGVLYDAHDAYVNDYNDNINPSVLNEHATAAFRYFHSNIQGYLKLITDNRYSTGVIRLSDHFNNPTVLESSNNFDDLTRGMATQPQQATDKFHTSEITDFLFRNNQPFGTDLKAFDIHRGRDHGLASYNDYRHFCGLPKAQRFEDFLDVIEPAIVEKLQQLYAHPDDVDLNAGGALERHVPGTLSGPTFLCIMTEQFYRTRVSDRFFYEHGDFKGAFTPEQLIEIRKSSIARIMCDNADSVYSMQPRAFEKLSTRNPTVSCHDYETIGVVNLEAWRDSDRGRYKSYFIE